MQAFLLEWKLRLIKIKLLVQRLEKPVLTAKRNYNTKQGIKTIKVSEKKTIYARMSMVLTGVEKQLMEILLKLKLMMFRDTKNKTTSPKRLAINCKRNKRLENSLLHN